MEDISIPELVSQLRSPDDGVRKKAAFRLQDVIGDPAFADNFDHAGGLDALRALALTATGNTLAYSLASLAKLLELDQGWDYVDRRLLDRLVELVVSHPLVNIHRGAVSILALVVSRSQNHASEDTHSHNGSSRLPWGFGALKPVLALHPTFLEMLVARLNFADHVFCANSLQLVNALMRDAIMTDSAAAVEQMLPTNEGTTLEEWPLFIKRLQDLGVIKAVYNLMQSQQLQDLSHPLYDFQALTKVLLRKWRSISVDPEVREHRRGLKAVHLSSLSEKERQERTGHPGTNGSTKQKPPHDPKRWSNLGFDTEHPAQEFEKFGVGYLGLMDLMDFARQRPEGSFHLFMLEKSFQPAKSRCPMAKASLAVTAILYDHFEVEAVASAEDGELFDQQRYAALESRSNLDGVFKPLLLQWSRLHTASLLAFVRLWETTGAQVDEDFMKIEELVRILVEHVVGLAARTDDIQDIERKMKEYQLSELRALQMELLELTHEDTWGAHLRQIKEELHHEATQFMREQRIRCLLAGSWFPQHVMLNNEPTLQISDTKTRPNSQILLDSNFKSARTSLDFGQPRTPLTPAFPTTPQLNTSTAASSPWRYAALSHNRRHLHYGDFPARSSSAPSLEMLDHKIDLARVVKVEQTSPDLADTNGVSTSIPGDSGDPSSSTPYTINLLGHASESDSAAPPSSPKASRHKPDDHAEITATSERIPLLTLHPPNATLHSEWLYGLTLLTLTLRSSSTSTAQNHSTRKKSRKDRTISHHGAFDHKDIEAQLAGIEEPQTQKIVEFLTRYGVKLRMLNVRFDYEGVLNGVGAGAALRGGVGKGARGEGEEVFGREGVDEDYFYAIGGGGAGV